MRKARRRSLGLTLGVGMALCCVWSTPAVANYTGSAQTTCVRAGSVGSALTFLPNGLPVLNTRRGRDWQTIIYQAEIWEYPHGQIGHTRYGVSGFFSADVYEGRKRTRHRKKKRGVPVTGDYWTRVATGQTARWKAFWTVNLDHLSYIVMDATWFQGGTTIPILHERTHLNSLNYTGTTSAQGCYEFQYPYPFFGPTSYPRNGRVAPW